MGEMFNYGKNPIQTILSLNNRIIFLPTIEEIVPTRDGVKIYYRSGRTEEIEDVTIEEVWKLLEK